MDPETLQRKRRGRRLVWLLAGLLVVLPLGGMLYATFGPNPPIIISKATTHITTPLTADGLPDYAAALLADMKKGVTPENNGAVLFMKAMWPSEDHPYYPISHEDGRLLCQELGLDRPPPPELRIGPLDTPENRRGIVQLLRRLLPVAQPSDPTGYGDTFAERGISAVDAEALQDERVEYVLYGCEPMQRPWTAEDLPFLAQWFDDRREQFDLIVEGAAKSQWYLPAADWVRGGRGSLSDNMTSVQLVREAMRQLQSRSLLYVGEGRADEAFRDAIAILRLGNHLSNRTRHLDRLVGNVVAVVGYFDLSMLIDSGQASAETLRGVLAEIQALRPAQTIRPEIVRAERFLVLDQVLSAAANGIEAPEFDEELFPGAITYKTPTGSLHHLLTDYSIDWNQTLTDINQHYDRLEASAQMPNRPTRDQAESAITSMDTEVFARSAAFQQANSDYSVYLSRDRRSKLLADAFLAERSAYRHHLASDDRHTVHRDLRLFHLALAISHDETGEYPESLDELVPDILPTLPIDPFNANPYAYRRTDDGFLLYSLGPDGIDHGGSYGSDQEIIKLEGIEIGAWRDPDTNVIIPDDPADQALLDKIPAGADDVSLRIPLPIEPWPWEE